MKYAILCLFLTGCALQQSLPDNIYQAHAIELMAQYNAKHGTDIPVPSVNIGPTPPLTYATDWFPKDRMRSFITLNSLYVAQNPTYMMQNTLPHELAHHICVLTIPGCTPDDHGDDHGKAWQSIALELGLSPDDGYITH